MRDEVVRREIEVYMLEEEGVGEKGKGDPSYARLCPIQPGIISVSYGYGNILPLPC